MPPILGESFVDVGDLEDPVTKSRVVLRKTILIHYSQLFMISCIQFANKIITIMKC